MTMKTVRKYVDIEFDRIKTEDKVDLEGQPKTVEIKPETYLLAFTDKHKEIRSREKNEHI